MLPLVAGSVLFFSRTVAVTTAPLFNVVGLKIISMFGLLEDKFSNAASTVILDI